MLRLLAAIFLSFGMARAVDVPPNVLTPELQHVLNSARSAVLYSLDPNLDRRSGELFCGVRVLGKARLQADETRRAADAFASAVSNWKGVTAECFNPRHGLSITSDGHRYDFVLCYECQQIAIYRDGNDVSELGATGSPATLNAILRTHHLRLAPTD
jgi:hypothetical protein